MIQPQTLLNVADNHENNRHRLIWFGPLEPLIKATLIHFNNFCHEKLYTSF
jgi:hypothetical protein